MHFTRLYQERLQGVIAGLDRMSRLRCGDVPNLQCVEKGTQIGLPAEGVGFPRFFGCGIRGGDYLTFFRPLSS